MAHNNSDSFHGIINAFNELRLANGAAEKEYTASYDGIVKAVLDIKKEWGNIGMGEYPPGWGLEYDGNGAVVGGSWIQEPQDGDLWFDENQGRLMVWVAGAYHQTNGADQLTVVSNSAPLDAVTGAFWYKTSTQEVYLYNGTAWVLVTTTTLKSDLYNAVNTSTDYASLKTNLLAALS